MGENNKINSETDSFVSVLNTEGFAHMDKQTQRAILSELNASKAKEGGLMGKLFGVKSTNAAMNIALIICLLLLVVGLVLNETQLWDKIVTIIAATIGYLFGKGRE